MDQTILKNVKMPFCPGCGYNASVRSIAKALENASYDPHNVILVSDIGCSGLVDPLFSTHTIHGLHGRSAALGLGISYGLNDPSRKVIAIQGDGGATIGLQHLLEASRRNVNMTLIILNNLVYGMTGGQISGLSSKEFKKLKNVPDNTPPFDVCELAYRAGAAYVARVSSPKRFESILSKAFASEGFSLVEMPSMCQPYGVKKLADLKEHIGPDVELYNAREKRKLENRKKPPFWNERDIHYPKFKSTVKDRVGVVIAGSAGGGIQAAAKLLATAGILSGLSTSMKGEYPITVGTGFSMAEVILSEKDINYSGLDSPDVMLILSDDGMQHVHNRMKKSSIVILDSSVTYHDLNSDKVIIQDFVKTQGMKGAALMAVAYWVNTFQALPLESMLEAAKSHKYKEELTRIITSVREPHLV